MSPVRAPGLARGHDLCAGGCPCRRLRTAPAAARPALEDARAAVVGPRQPRTRRRRQSAPGTRALRCRCVVYRGLSFIDSVSHCPGGGIGKRNRLKLGGPKGRVGSNPTPGILPSHALESRCRVARMSTRGEPPPPPPPPPGPAPPEGG